MKVHLNRQELAEALGAIGYVVASRTPKPILQGVLIDARQDHCLLAATDLEIGLRYLINQVEVEDVGKVVLPADKLGQIVRESNDETIQLEIDDTVCHIRGKDSHYQLNTQDASDFPPVAELEGDPDFDLDASLLRRMSEWTVFAAARENTRYAINGVLWEKKEEVLTLVATDGRRLSLARGEIAGGDGPNIESIVPVKTMALFQRILHDSDSTVSIKLSGNQMIVRSTRATISTGLVEGKFPKYSDVIPSDCDRTLTVGTQEFLSAVRRAALLTDEESKGIRLAFTDGALTLSGRAPSQGEATVDLPVKYSGGELVIGFNPHFLIEALKTVQLPEVQFALKEPNRPGLLKCGPDFLYVVMPVNLS